MLSALTVVSSVFLSALAAAGQTVGDARDRAALERLLKRLPEKEFFNEWLKKSGELPPDFDALPSQFYLSDPLMWDKNGRLQRVARADWPERRKQLAGLVEKWLLGTAPPPPGNVVAEILEKTQDRGHTVWKAQLRFGPNHAAKLNVTYLPQDQSRPAPIFLCDSGGISWAEGAMAQGLAWPSTARAIKDESLAYANLFGDYDWSSFRRRGWSVAASWTGS